MNENEKNIININAGEGTGTSSVEIKHTSKGNTFGVKIYNDDPDIAVAKAEALFDELRGKYEAVDKE